MNQRFILLSVIIISAIATIALNEVSADKGTGWFDARNFYKKVKNLDVFDDYPYKDSKINVKIIHVGVKKITRDFIIQYGKDTLFIDHKEFKDDKQAKTSFYIDDEEKKKVCMMSYKDNYQKCKSFRYSGDKDSKLTFYIQ